MVESSINFDLSQAINRLDGLRGVAKQHLPRSMAVAAGTVFRDEAQARAPEGPTGNLRAAIYLAYSESRSIPDDGLAVYSVTWNKRKAPHGHLVEFGHWQNYVTYVGSDGKWYTNRRKPLAQPKWVPAYPFLRPAYDGVVQIALRAGIERGRVRVAELLADPETLEQYV